MNTSQLTSLEDRAIRGVFWSAIERIGPQAVQLIVSIVLARLLLPAQFGLIGMLSVFLALGQILINSGFSSALIQKQDATEIHFCSVFYLNILLGLTAAAILFLVAPWIARFYNQPSITSLTRFLSLNFVFSAFGVIQIAILTKRLDFQIQMKVSLLASMGSGMVGIGMALLGFGVWSLAAQSVSLTLFNTVLLWIFNAWRPRIIFSLASLQGLFGFATRLLVSNILDTVVPNFYTVVIGRLFSPADLGYYTRANLLQQLPSQSVGQVVRRVAFPMFSEIQDDYSKVKNGFRKACRAVALINFPLMIGLMVCAETLVITLLTEKWSSAIPYLRLLCLAGLFYPLHMINLNMLLAKGRSDIYFRLNVMFNVLILIILAITWRWGIQAIILGQIALSMVAYYLSSKCNEKIVGHGTNSQIRDLWPYLVAAGIMGGVVYALTWLTVPHPAVLLLAQVITGALVYTLVCRGFRLPVFMDGWQIVRRRITSFRNALV